jgi:hypothetical protein
MPANAPEPLEDLALLIEPRLRQRQMRDGLEARLRFAGRKAKLVVPQELAGASFPEMLGVLLDQEAELRAVDGDRERWFDQQEPGPSIHDLKDRWRHLERNARRLRALLGPEFDRFAAAERPPPERRSSSSGRGRTSLGAFGHPWMS